jgi:hypothetical protein
MPMRTLFTQLTAKLAALTWASGAAGPVLASVRLAAAAPAGKPAGLRLPAAFVVPGGDGETGESGGIETATAQIVVIAENRSDPHGTAVVADGARVDAGDSAGAGLLRLVDAITAAFPIGPDAGFAGLAVITDGIGIKPARADDPSVAIAELHFRLTALA